MRRGYRLKRRKKESVLLFAALFITGMLIYAGLANWERTPHLYEYDKKSLAKEIKAADANRQASKEEDAEAKTRKEGNQKNHSMVDNHPQHGHHFSYDILLAMKCHFLPILSSWFQTKQHNRTKYTHSYK